jgi:hypothetical protein
MIDYEELRIRAFKTGTNRFFLFANGPAAAAAVITLRKPAAEYRRELAILFAEEFGQCPAQSASTTTERARRLGRELFQTLLPEPILDCLRQSQQLAQDAGRGLRLCFDVPAELMDIPFEILCSPPEDVLGELALQSALSVVRSLPGQPKGPLRLPQAADDRQPISLVLVVSSPRGLHRLQVEREIESIEQALPPILQAMDPPPLQVLGSRRGRVRATLNNLRNLLLQQAGPCLVVLIAHGAYDENQKENVVLLERENGSPEPVPGRILSGTLKQAPGLRLAVLNLCLGTRSAPGEPFSGLAQSLIAGGVPAVVAMQMEVSDKAASVFSPALLQAICRNRTIDEAVADGRIAVHTREARIQWANPVLFFHRDCGQGWLFKVQEVCEEERPLPDPIHESQLALQRFRRAPNLRDIAVAAPFLKQRRQWRQVSLLAAAGLDRSPRDSSYIRLAQEADAELRVGELERACGVLALEGDAARVARPLAALRAVLPSEITQNLSWEVEQAGEAFQRCREALESEHREAWTSAIEHYERILELRPGGYLDVSQRLEKARLELTLATLYGETKAAVEKADWEQALARSWAILAQRPSGYRDTFAAAAYAAGRIAEKSQRWAEEAAALAEVPETWREDVAPRRFYAEGRHAEEQSEWATTAAAYRLAANYEEDAGERLSFARVRQAMQQGDWAGAVTAAAALPENHRESPLVAYAQGRLAEEREAWLEAVAFFARHADCADAAARQRYALGRLYEAEGVWSQALAAWAPLPRQHRDVADRTERLRRLMAATSWAADLAAAGLVADPCAASWRTPPYAVLGEAGIHPNSSAAAIKDASFTLMEKGAMTPEARLAWDELRSPAGRLRVDAFLYRLQDPEELCSSLDQLASGLHADLIAALGQALPGDAPLFLLLDGRREEAIAAWEKLLGEDPAGTAAAHGLALACYFHARGLEESGAEEPVKTLWEKSIAAWVVVLGDDVFWDVWRRERTELYPQPVTPVDIARLRSELGQEVLDHLATCADRSAADGHVEREERFRALTLALEIELEGARLLKEIGGLRLDEGGGRPLVCGPLYLHQRDLGSRLGRQVAELEAADDGREREYILSSLDAALGTGDIAGGDRGLDPGIAPGTLFRLRCVFSELGPPLLLLDRCQPELALRAIPPIYQMRLAELPGDAGDDEEFARANLSYQGLPHRLARLHQDAVELAVRAHLALARNALATGERGLAVAFRCWRKAIEVSRSSSSQIRTKRAIARVVLARVRGLAQEHGRRLGERLTAALELLDLARSLIGGADAGQLMELTAKLLTDRGVWYGNGCDEGEEPNYEKAAQDLRRALELTPDSIRARDNLARALICWAANLPGKLGSQSPLKLLAEAVAVLHEGLCRTAGQAQLIDMLRRGLDELEECFLFELDEDDLARRIAKPDGSQPPAGPSHAEEARRMVATAEQRRAQGDETGELMDLITAVRHNTGDDTIRQSLLKAVQRQAGLAG